MYIRSHETRSRVEVLGACNSDLRVAAPCGKMFGGPWDKMIAYVLGGGRDATARTDRLPDESTGISRRRLSIFTSDWRLP